MGKKKRRRENEVDRYLMEDQRYGECRRSHADLGGERDGCQEFMAGRNSPLECQVCGCHRNFHSKPFRSKIEIVYRECKRIHDYTGGNTVDGCKEFIQRGTAAEPPYCAACHCHKSFHRNEVYSTRD